jgi:signal transduction histidine kinase
VPDGPLNAFQLDFVQRVGHLLAIAAHTARLFDQVLMQSCAMLAQRTRERAQAAREIHDGPLQVLPAMAIKLGSFAKQWALPPAQAQELNAWAGHAQATGDVLRAICAGLRPPVLAEGVVAVVEDAVDRFAEIYTGLTIEVATPEEALPALKTEVVEAVFHVAAETLTNIGKHA